jgi:imidazolonepropionase-like amidohydrolase
MPEQRLLANARIVDLDAGSVTEGWLRIDDGRIAGFGAGAASPGDAQVEDLGGAYVIPGLWDVHVHLSFERPIPPNETVVQRTFRCIGAAVNAVRAGITGLRSAGENEYIDSAAKGFFERGTLVGPRIVPSGYFLTTTAGHITDNPVVLALDGPIAFRKAVRENIRHGAEVIKINMSGGIWGPGWDNIHAAFHADDELEAVFGTAKQRGFPVMAHAAGAASAKLAARWGAKSIEHGYALDEEAIGMMKEAGTVFVPTLAMSQLSAALAEDEFEKDYMQRTGFVIPEDIRQKALGVAEQARWGFDAARKAGIPIACGSDMNPVAEGAKLEVALMVRCGMTPREALIAATTTSADLAGHGDRTGSIEVGKDADLVAVETDPLADIYSVRRVKRVWRAGVPAT